MNQDKKFMELLKLSAEMMGFIRGLKFNAGSEIRAIIEKNLSGYQDRLDKILEINNDR